MPDVTIRDVAEKAGVSVATVSYVINDKRNVRPETEERVMAVVRELGFSPKAAARSLVIGHSPFLGLILPDIGNPFFPEVTKAFQDAACGQNMETIVINTNYDLERTRHAVDRLMSLQVPGAAFLTSQVDPLIREMLATRGIPAVYLDHGDGGPHMATVAIDYRRGILDAVEHLAQLGHRRIGFIGGPVAGRSAELRRIAFMEGIESAGLSATITHSDFSVEGGYGGCGELLNIDGVTAVMAANDLMAIGALHCAYDRRVSVPNELSVIGFDDITFSQFTQPALTTVAVPRAEIGRVAFQALDGLIAHRTRPGVQHRILTTLVVRETTAAPMAR